MALLRRLAFAVSMLVCLSVTFAAQVAAGSPSILGQGPGGPGLLPAGNYVNTNVFAGFNVCCSPQLSINVDASTNVSNPLVGPSTSQSEVDVNFQACDYLAGVCGGGCFIPDGAPDFTFGSTSAVLNTTVTDTTRACQGNPVSGFTRPFTVNVTWTVVGSSFTSSGGGRLTCGGYASESRTTSTGGTATNATASTSIFPGSTFPTNSANLSSFDQRIHAQGTPLDSCPDLGGRGAGFGPQAAGNYHFVTSTASFAIVPTDPSQPYVNVSVTSFNNVSSPTGGPSTTLSETDLNIFQPTFPQSFSGCFLIPASAFTISSGLQTASLHVSIDPTTPACPQSNNTGLPPSFTVDVTWTPTGPVATLRSEGGFSCAGIHTIGSGLQRTANASASGGISGLADSFSNAQGEMFTSDTTTHVQGTQNCF